MSPESSLDGADDRRPPFACSWRAEGDAAASVQVSGDLDMATAPQLERALRDACAHAPLVVLDVHGVSFMDSSGLHVLVAAAQRARHSRGRMVMVGASRQIEAILDLTSTRDAIDALSDSFEPVRKSVVERQPGFRPLANPVNASVVAGRVMAIEDTGLWLHAPDGTILRAWAPPTSGSPVPVGSAVEIYLDRRGAVNGWFHAESAIAVNQRRLPPGAEPETAAMLDCRGVCGVTWQAPAGAELAAHNERCLTCAGPLAYA